MVTVEVKIGQFWICFQDRAYRGDVRKVFCSIWMNEWFFSILIRKKREEQIWVGYRCKSFVFKYIEFEMFVIHLTRCWQLEIRIWSRGRRL